MRLLPLIGTLVLALVATFGCAKKQSDADSDISCIPATPFILSIDQIEQAYRSKGYTLYDNGDYDLNIFGVRRDPNICEPFHDFIGVLYKVSGQKVLELFHATTVPTMHYRLKPMNRRGTAILVPGSYANSHRIGMHRGRQRALVQNKPLPIWRDGNRNEVLDCEGSCKFEDVGINIHCPSKDTEAFQRTSSGYPPISAGCQVIENHEEFGRFMELVTKSAAIHGTRFSYTLFEEGDFDN